MAALKVDGHVTVAVWICSFLACICFTTLLMSVPSQAESPPQGVITGYVLDENGNSVSAANVTLWQGDQMWQHTKFIYSSSANPQTSYIHNNNEGYFLFGFAFPGDYTVKTEKEGYTGSTPVSVGNKAVMANVTLAGYHVPVFSQEQLSCAGAITGTVYEMSGHAVTDGTNLSLWQNGQMLKMPGNPQAGDGDVYTFEHLPPGQYEVRAVFIYPVFSDYPANVTVNVGNGPVTADVILPFHGPYHDTIPLPTPSATLWPSSPLPQSDVTPASSSGLIVTMASLGIVVLLVCRFRKPV